MRRTKLIWFAAGLLVATLANLAAGIALGSMRDVPREQFMVISDRDGTYDLALLDKKEIVENNPRILRECSIEGYVWGLSAIPDGEGVTSGFRIADQSEKSLDCILGAVMDQKILARVELARHPNELSPILATAND